MDTRIKKLGSSAESVGEFVVVVEKTYRTQSANNIAAIRSD